MQQCPLTIMFSGTPHANDRTAELSAPVDERRRRERAYEETRQRHIEHLLPQFAQHFERIGWSADRLREERRQRLRDLVRVAVERSSWHRARLGEV